MVTRPSSPFACTSGKCSTIADDGDLMIHRQSLRCLFARERGGEEEKAIFFWSERSFGLLCLFMNTVRVISATRPIRHHLLHADKNPQGTQPHTHTAQPSFTPQDQLQGRQCPPSLTHRTRSLSLCSGAGSWEVGAAGAAGAAAFAGARHGILSRDPSSAAFPARTREQKHRMRETVRDLLQVDGSKQTSSMRTGA